MEGLHGHFHEQRVETHMYTSQWFLTIYTAKFPITMVFRVMDLYLCEVCVRSALVLLCFFLASVDYEHHLLLLVGVRMHTLYTCAVDTQS